MTTLSTTWRHVGTRRAHCATAIVAGLATAAALAAGPAQATPPSHVSEPVDLTYQDDYLTDFCGFEVLFSLVGTLKATLRYDRSGNIISEIDTQPDLALTFHSPETGRSFSFPFAAINRTDYTDGAALGSETISYGGGLFLKVPGISANAGHAVFSGVVIDHTPSGIPIVAFTGVITSVGHETDPDATDAAFCEALAP
jgi:hypothetical protein